MNEPVVIVGATGAIGSALARRVAATGRPVHLVGRDPARLTALAGELGGTTAVADALDGAALAASVRQAGPRLWGLAYCVGSIVMLPLKRAKESDFVDAFRHERGRRRAGRGRRGGGAACRARQRGRAVQHGGGARRVRQPCRDRGRQGRGRRADGVARGRVGAQHPGELHRPQPDPVRHRRPDDRQRHPGKAIAAQHPIPRLGEGEDAGALAAFLLSADAGWITGQVFAVDGGRSTVRTRG